MNSLKESVSLEDVCVIGLGAIGLPTARHIASAGLNVKGHDISRRAVNLAGKEFFAKEDLSLIPESDVFVVCVNTSYNSGMDVSQVESVLGQISERNESSRALVCVESTMPVGATRRLADRFGLSKVVVVPHRFWPERAQDHGVNQHRVMGSLNDDSLRLGLSFFRKLGIPLTVCSSLEVAELSKLAENSHRFLEIAFAEELFRVSKSLDLDFEEVKSAVSTHFNYSAPLRIMEPRDGIGGTCLPKDIKFLSLSAGTSTPLLKGAIEADSAYRELRTP